MSRISNELASQIAFKLTEKSRLISEQHHVEYRELATCLYEESTPALVKEMLDKYPDWVDTGNSIRLNGHGFNYEYISPTRPVVSNSTQNLLILTSKTADKLTSARRVWEKSKDKYKQLKDETKQALLALRTFNNIRKELPEAAPMLPPPMSNALVCNFKSLNNRLQKQPEIKKEKQSA